MCAYLLEYGGLAAATVLALCMPSNFPCFFCCLLTYFKINFSSISTTHMRGSRKFCQEGPTLMFFFFGFFGFFWGGGLVDEGREDLNKRAIICPPAKRHLNGVLLACQ